MTTLRRINQDDLRNHNLSVVISTLLRAAEPMSRAELAKQTGLTKVTMSLLVSMLVDNGVVREGTPSVQSSYGRPSTPLLIAAGVGVLFCILAFIGIIFVIVRALMFGDPTSGWPSMVCIILLCSGVQLFCTGIVGEYLAKTYLEVKHRPIYIVAETEEDQ